MQSHRRRTQGGEREGLRGGRRSRKAVLALIVAASLTRAATAAAPVLPIEQELRVARTQAITSFGKGARCIGKFVQRADEPIVMEAELATRLTLQNGQAPGLDPLASGGAYLHFVESAAWTFTVATPGKYVLWERAFFPLKGTWHWNHTEALDGGDAVYVIDSAADVGFRGPEDGWKWARAHTYELSAGEHTLALTYLGGARLDVLALTRSDTAPDLALLKTSYTGPVSGEVWTVPVQPFDVARWSRAVFSIVGAAETQIEASRDDGRTWSAFDPRSDLSAWQTEGGGKDRIAFHLAFQGEAGKAPPFFGGGKVVYEAGKNNSRIVENGRMRLEFDPYGLKSIRDLKAGAAVSQAAPFAAPLVTLTVKKPGDAPTETIDLYSGILDRFETAGTPDAPAATLSHVLANKMRVTTTVALLANGQSEWQAQVQNPTELEVAAIAFPVVAGCRLGEDLGDDWMFLAKCWGQVWQCPAGSGRVAVEWGPAMRWTSLWDRKQGLYLGIEDDRLDDYAFMHGGSSSNGATLGACQRILVKPQGSWTSAVYRLALTGGDWHEGADIYRGYVARALKPCTVPPHVKWLVDAWAVQESGRADAIGWDMIAPTALPLMAANRQMLDGSDHSYCGLYPYPSIAWGSIREFSQKLAVRRALGGLYTPYHNFRLWSPGYGHYERIGITPKRALPADIPKPDDKWYKRATTWTFDGSYPAFEQLHHSEIGMAMASRDWRDWLAYWTRRYLAWGADGMYYDQFGMIYPNGRLYPGFDTYGNWVPATLESIATIKAESLAKNPYYTCTGEFANDIYGQYVDLHMVSGVMNRLEFFRYCNPDQLLIDGGWNGGLNPTYGTNRVFFTWQVGARFEQPPADGRILALRRAVKSALYDATFMDTVGLVVRDDAGKPIVPEYSFSNAQNAPTRGVIGRWFLYGKEKQRGAVVNLINSPVRPDATVALDTGAFGPVQSAWALTLEGGRLPVQGTQQGGQYVFAVPASELSSVVLSGGLGPLVEWAFAPAMTQGEPAALQLRITNVNKEPLSGTARLRLPERWTGSGEAGFGPIEPGKTVTVTMNATASSRVKTGRYDLWCDVVTPSGTFAAYSLAAVNDPVLADFRGSPGAYHVWLTNLSSRAFDGAVTFRAPAGLGVTASSNGSAQATASFRLLPRAELRVPVYVAGQDRLRWIAEMTALVKVGRQKMELVRGVIPPLPNGDFERDGAGDLKPDGWMCRKADAGWRYERLHLAEGAHGGKYCLQLDPPQPGEQFVYAQRVHSVLKPQTRYRVSVWVKSDATNGVYANLFAELGNGKTGPEWKPFAAEFTSGQGEPGFSFVTLVNRSDRPAYFDDITVEELPTPVP